MIIRIIATLLLLSSLSFPVQSQSFEWVQSAPVLYSMNPSYPESPVWYDDVNSRVYDCRIDTVALIYGQSVLGTSFVESRDTTGQVMWQYRIGDFASVQRIVTDLSGNVYVGGLYQQTLYLDGTDSLEFILVPFAIQNTFIIKLDPQGNLIWKRNVTVTWSDYEGIEAMATDPAGNCWFALTDFFIAKIVRMDANGIDQEVRTIHNGKRIGNISFDPTGGLFVSGAAESGNFIMGTDTFVAVFDYNMFIARYSSNGQPVWAHFGHDITFQKPMVIADASGSAFFAGNRFDTTSFNGFLFTSPYLSSDFFAFKIDSLGTVSWGLQQPQLTIGPFGTFEQGSNLMVAADAAGKFYMGGIQRGTVDWGNGYISSTPGFVDRKIAITCIDVAGKVQWVKLGGGLNNNYMHALSVSPAGSCYFTGSYRDTAVFDSITINTTNLYNFAVGKISAASSTGIDDVTDENFSLYPNPTKGLLYISEEMINGEIRIFDVSGKLVYYEDKVKNQMLNIEKLNPGVYIVTFKNTGSAFHSKIIVY